MFTYVNPRRDNLFQSVFAKQIIQLKKKKKKILYHGNLKSIRSFVSLNDAMSAYWIVALKGKIGRIYNIGGKKSYTVGSILKRLLEISKINPQKKINKKLLRVKDVTLQLPNTNLFKKDTGWEPKEKLDFALKFLLNELNKKN